MHDVGYLESGLCNSFEQIAICDELINYVKTFMQGLEVSEETLALDLIDEVGPDGDFMGTRHTVDHFKEHWYPQLFNRQAHDEWAAAGSLTLREKARARVEEILLNHQPEPLPAGVQIKIDEIAAG